MAKKNLTSKELIEALVAAEVVLTGKEKLPDLQALATEKGIATEKEDTHVTATEVVSVDVHTAKGGYVRTYSREQHGAEFRDKAEQYAGKIKGVVK